MVQVAIIHSIDDPQNRLPLWRPTTHAGEQDSPMVGPPPSFTQKHSSQLRQAEIVGRIVGIDDDGKTFPAISSSRRPERTNWRKCAAHSAYRTQGKHPEQDEPPHHLHGSLHKNRLAG